MEAQHLRYVRSLMAGANSRMPASRYFSDPSSRYKLPRERFSRVPSMFDSLGVEVPYPTRWR
jgi:hypothetical protein